MKIGILIALATFVVAKQIDLDSLSSFLDEDEDEELSVSSLDLFYEKYEGDYGYNHTLSEIRFRDLKRLQGATYLDYTGSGVYLESQVRKCANLLVSNMFGNAHSVNPSSERTEAVIESARDRVLQFFNTTSDEYIVVFTSGATQALHIVGEAFPWSSDSLFYYLSENHNSVLGIREYASTRGNGFRSVNEEDLATMEKEVDESAIPLETTSKPFSLFAYPAEDNFAGVKYPLDWIEKVHQGHFNPNHRWLVLLDAAAFIPTNPLNLSKIKPDFVCMSFYKLFGYPSGVGALLIRKSVSRELKKVYWGGGTVVVASEQTAFRKELIRPSSRFEDGTLGFLNIACLSHGFDVIDALGMNAIQRHVNALTEFLADQLSTLHHSNGKPVVELYGKHSLHDPSQQGGIVSFNILRSDGRYLGYYRVQQDSAKKDIHLRTGCHCNPGACRKYLNQPEDVFQEALKEKRSCADSVDSYHEVPLGGGTIPSSFSIVRASLGYLTSIEDVITLVDFVKEYIDVWIVC